MFVNGHNLEVRETIEQNPKRESTHSAEAIDGDSDRHWTETSAGRQKRKTQKEEKEVSGAVPLSVCLGTHCQVVCRFLSLPLLAS